MGKGKGGGRRKKLGKGPEFLGYRRETAKRYRVSILLLDIPPIIPATEYPNSGGTEWKRRRSRMHSGQTIKCIHAAIVTDRHRGLPVSWNSGDPERELTYQHKSFANALTDTNSRIFRRLP